MLEFMQHVSKKSKIEKQSTIPLSQMMTWWTGKPLLAGRVAILTSVLDDREKISRFMGLDSKKPWDYMPDPEEFKITLGKDPSDVKVLDPFAGTGRLAFPTAQLGLDLTVSDYNPVAWLILRGMLEFPRSYGKKLAEDFEAIAELVIKKTQEETGMFFGKNDLVYIWSWCIKCTNCGQRFPLMNHMYVSNKQKIGLKLIKKPKNNFGVELIEDIDIKDAKKFTQKGGQAVCFSCKTTIESSAIYRDITKRRDRQLLVVQEKLSDKFIDNKLVEKQEKSRKKRIYRLATEKDLKLVKKASKKLQSTVESLKKEILLPTENILPSHRIKNTLWNYGITTWDEYFEPRQILVLCSYIKNTINACNKVSSKKKRQILATYLSFVLAKRVNNGCFGVVWNSAGNKTEPALSMRRPSIAYNFGETNPFVSTRGSIINMKKSVYKAINSASIIKTPVECRNESVTMPTSLKYDIILTDPPYGDDVQYGELSEFLYVWMYRILKNYYTLPERIRRDEDFCESKGRFGSTAEAKKFFEAGMERSFQSLHSKLVDNGLLVVFFAHSSSSAWGNLTIGLQKAGFNIVSSHTLHTELATNPLAKNKMSFMSSIILTCKKAKKATGFYEDIMQDIETNILQLLRNIGKDRLAELPITNLLIMATGKILETYTKYTIIKRYARLPVPRASEIIDTGQKIVMREIIRLVMERDSTDMGQEMSFYLLARMFTSGILSSDVVLKLGLPFGLNAKKLIDTGILIRDGDLKLAPLIRNIGDDEAMDPDNVYFQLSYLMSINGPRLTMAIGDPNTKRTVLKQVVSLMLKKRITSGVDWNDHEKLRILADHLGLEITGIGQDTVMSKRRKRIRTDPSQTRLPR